MNFPSDIAFTDRVKAIQTRKGSRDTYARLERQHPWPTTITPDLAQFVATQRSVFLATATSGGQPYIQHRGGPPGFLTVLDEQHLAFADFAGNRQYISQGNLSENPQAFLFLMDYVSRTRVKIWGEAKVLEDAPELLQGLMPPADEYRAKPEQVIVFRVKAWDKNCPQHIPVRLDYEQVQALLKAKDHEIQRLQQALRQYTGNK